MIEPTHQCSACLASTTENVNEVAPPLVLAGSTCPNRPGIGHVWARITKPELFRVHIYKERSNLKNLSIKSIEDVHLHVQIKWRSLAFIDYSLRYKVEDSIIEDLITISQLQTSVVNHILVVPNLKGFSKGANRDEVLQELGVSSANLVYDDSKFSGCTSLDDSLFEEVVGICADDICRRLTVFKPNSGERISEYTCREFVSPILVHSMNLMIRFLKETNNPHSLVLCCEKQIIGRRFYGPVDYSIMYGLFDIVLTAAKKSDLESGLYQNLLQQQASLELLASIFTDRSILGKRRRDEFERRYADLKVVTTAGIVTTGNSWMFTKVINEGDSKTIYHSGKIFLDLDSRKIDSDPDFLTSIKKGLKIILKTICQLILDQIREVHVHAKVIDKYKKDFSTVSLWETQIGCSDTFNNDFEDTENEEVDNINDT